MKRGRGDTGIALVSTLATLAFCGAILVVLQSAHQDRIKNGAGFLARSQAQAIADGAVSAVMSALLRDAKTAPDQDHYREAWADTAQQEFLIANGTFQVKVRDLQGLYNLNRLASKRPAELRLATQLFAEHGLETDWVLDLAALLQSQDSLGSILQLSQADIPPDALAQIAQFASVLPVDVPLNLNTAPEVVFEQIVQPKLTAKRLLKLRADKGYLDPGDFQRVGILMPIGVGWTSQFFAIDVSITIDQAVVVRAVLVKREVDPPTVSVVQTHLSLKD